MMALCPTRVGPTTCRATAVVRPAPRLTAAFSGSRRQLLATSLPQRQRQGLQTQAYLAQYPDPEFMAETREAFPDKGIANVEEARVLFESGYKYLDVRTPLEYDEVGKVKGSINVPVMYAEKKYDPEQKKKVVIKEENLDFVSQVEYFFPNKETPILVACSDGRTYSMDALEALDEAGYVNLVGLKGGYNAWARVFDYNLRRRMTGEYAEQYTHDGDSCGIHSSGAGFDRVDKIEAWVPPKY